MSEPGYVHYTCPKCGVTVTDLGRHQRRNRCTMQHIRKQGAMK
jgi:hypothetical protein